MRKEAVVALCKVISLNFPLSRYPVSRPTFEPGTSGILSRGANHSTTTSYAVSFTTPEHIRSGEKQRELLISALDGCKGVIAFVLRPLYPERTPLPVQ